VVIKAQGNRQTNSGFCAIGGLGKRVYGSVREGRGPLPVERGQGKRGPRKKKGNSYGAGRRPRSPVTSFPWRRKIRKKGGEQLDYRRRRSAGGENLPEGRLVVDKKMREGDGKGDLLP